MNTRGKKEHHDSDDLHRDVKDEILFFHNAANGDIPAIRQNISSRAFRDGSGVGVLSTDPVLNLKYHMVITTAILTRMCVERGLETEMAFRMSDYYIRQLDSITTEDGVERVHDEMVMDFTRRMKDVRSGTKRSRPVSLCLDYIYAHLDDRIPIRDLAEHAGVSASYLSRTFSEEMGISISDYIRDLKIERAQDLLVNTDISILDISCQLSFSSQSHFIQIFKQQTGVTPKKYRTQNKRGRWSMAKDYDEKERYPFLCEDEE